MGQAKLRGTFQQRQAAGIKKRNLLKVDRLNKIAEYESQLTPEQRAANKKVSMMLSFVLGVCWRELP